MTLVRASGEAVPSGLSQAKQQLLAELLAGRRAAPGASAMGPRPADAPLTPSILQEANWEFGDRIGADRALYDCLPVRTLSSCVRLTGPLDVEALRLSFEDIVRRHDVLRTTYQAEGAGIRARVSDLDDLDFQEVDLAAGDEAGRYELALELARTEEARDFDLERGPLIRIRLFRLAPDDALLFVMVDHIAFDGWSFGVFVRELNAHYGARRARLRASLPPLPLQYGDFAYWSRRAMETGGLSRAQQYWRDNLRDVPRLLLPSMTGRQTPQPYRQGFHKVELGAELSARIGLFSRAHDVTPFAVLLAAFKLLLWQATGQRRVTVLCPVANRADAQLHGLIGKFANSAALQAEIDPAASFIDFVRTVRDAAGKGIAHQAVPFSLVAQELFPGEHPFHASFCLQNYPMPRLELQGLGTTEVFTNFGTTVRDLAVVLVDDAGTYDGYATFNSILFSPEMMAGFFSSYTDLLADCLEGGESPTAALLRRPSQSPGPAEQD